MPKPSINGNITPSKTEAALNKEYNIDTKRSFANALEKQKYAIESAKLTQQELQKIISLNSGSPWPQVQPKSEVGGRLGFLPSLLLQPTLQQGSVTSETEVGRGLQGDVTVTQTYANYKFVDWRGQMLNPTGVPWPQTTTNQIGDQQTDRGFLPNKLIPGGNKPYTADYEINGWEGQMIDPVGNRSIWPQTTTNQVGDQQTDRGFLPNKLIPGGNQPYNASYELNGWEGQMIDPVGNRTVWPQTTVNPGLSTTKGFLPPQLMDPVRDSEGIKPYDSQYPISDWGGQKIQDSAQYPQKSLTTEDRFYSGKDLPRANPVLVDKPHSQRDVPLIFGDGRMDYFRHSLQVLGDGKAVSNLTPIDNTALGASNQRKDKFIETPWENEDPPMFGFDIIFDSFSSPLLNGSLTDFIANYSNVSEIASKRQVYEEFKNQFQKFFRINGEMKVDETQIAMTSIYNKMAGADSSSSIHNPHKKNYLGHYVKKITGLDFLIEQNKGDTIKYTPDYKKDFITLQLREDVSMNMGTLAHLYKTLYWSKPNGKMLIPENLLRFNCIIIISECRNFQRVKKGIKNPENINIIKDNLSRYVYTLRECQFYFDKLPLNNEVDLGDQGPSIYESYDINFDFKYSSVKLERFVPNGDWGNYVGIDGGSIWKVGNKGTRNSRGTTGSQELSTPRFFTVGPDNETYTYYPNLKINGEDKPYIMAVYGPKADQQDEFKTAQKKSSEGTVGGNNEGTGGQNVGELGAGNDGQAPQGNTTTTGGGSTPGGGTTPTEGSGSSGTIDDLKKQSEQATANAKEQADNQNVQESIDNLKAKSSIVPAQFKKLSSSVDVSGALTSLKSKSNSVLSGQLKKATEGLDVGGALNSLKVKSGSAVSQLQKINQASIVSSVTSGFKKIAPGAISNQLSNAGLDKITKIVGTPLSQIVANKSISSDIVSGKFFDKMGSLKIEDSLKGLGNLKSSVGGALSGGLSGGLASLKSAVPSLDSVKTKFSEAKSKATSGFFDIRGNLKSSLTDGANKLKGQAGGLLGDIGGQLGGLGGQAQGLLGGLTSKISSAVPSLDSVKTKFSEAKSQATSGFFDIRGNLKSSLTDGANKLKGQAGGLLGGIGDQAQGLLDGLTSKVSSAVPSLDSVKTKFSAAISEPTSGFFDIRGNLKSSLTDAASKITTSFDQAVDDANSLTSKVSQKKNDTINLVKGLLNQEVEESKNTLGKFVSVDNLKEKFTNATEIPASSFFDVRGQISGQKGNDTSSLGLRKNLLNNTIDKIYNTQKTGSSQAKSNTPPATSFFDLKNQLKDFLGGSLGDKLTE